MQFIRYTAAAVITLSAALASLSANAQPSARAGWSNVQISFGAGSGFEPGDGSSRGISLHSADSAGRLLTDTTRLGDFYSANYDGNFVGLDQANVSVTGGSSLSLVAGARTYGCCGLPYDSIDTSSSIFANIRVASGSSVTVSGDYDLTGISTPDVRSHEVVDMSFTQLAGVSDPRLPLTQSFDFDGGTAGPHGTPILSGSLTLTYRNRSSSPVDLTMNVMARAQVQPVPEPETWAMATVGLLLVGLGCRRWRR